MPNVNCLKGIKCPKCGQDDRFRIVGTASFDVVDDGTEDYHDVEWNDNSFCYCPECSFHDTLDSFIKRRKKKAKPGRFVEPKDCDAQRLLGWIARVAHVKVGHDMKGYIISEDIMKRVKELAVDPATS